MTTFSGTTAHKNAPHHLAATAGHQPTTPCKCTTIETLGQALSALRPCRCEDRETWLKVGMAIHAETDGSDSGRELWDAWSQQSEKYQSKVIGQQWRSFKPGGGVTAGTLYHMADVDRPEWRAGQVVTPPKARAVRGRLPIDPPSSRSVTTYSTSDDAIESLANLGPISARWVYLDAEWQECGHVLRWDLPDGAKTIRPVSRQLDGTWAISAMPGPRPLFNLPFLRESGCEDPVFLCEGEKDASTLTEHGLIATTSSGGANAASKTDFSPLAGRDVALCPDNDPAGNRYTQVVTKMLQQLDTPARVSVLDVSDLPTKSSLADELTRRVTEGVSHE